MMTKKRYLCIALALILALSMLSGCGKSEEKASATPAPKETTDDKTKTEDKTTEETTEEASGETSDETSGDVSAEKDPFGKYENTITVTQGRGSDSGGASEEWILDDNPFTDALYDTLNIRLQNDWTLAGEELIQKVDLVLATGDMPDIMIVNSWAKVRSLYDKGMIEDLTDAFGYISPAIKSYYDSYANNRNIESVTYDGKILAIPNTNLGGQNNITWIRRDWLENLNLSEPKTLQELMDVAKAFVEQDPDGNSENDTIGIAMNGALIGSNNTPMTIDPIFYAMGAYPKAWLKDDSGKVYYGSVSDEMKNAVTTIASYVKQGLITIDPEPSIYDMSVGNKVGILCGPWWMVWDGALWDSRANDTSADWMAYGMPLDAAGNLSAPLIEANNAYLVVKKGFSNPEAVVKMLNLQMEIYNRSDLGKSVYKSEDMPQNFNAWPIPLQLCQEDLLMVLTNQLKAAIDAKDPMLIDETNRYVYDFTMQYLEDNEAPVDAWSQAVARYYSTEAAQKDYVGVEQAIYVLTPSMMEKYTALLEYEMEVIPQILKGQLAVDEYDKFADQWISMGGGDLIKEIEDYIK